MDGVGKSQPPVRVLIAIDVRLYREGLAATLADRSFLDVIGTSATRDETLAAASQLEPHLVLIDVALPQALRAMNELHEQHPAVAVLAFAVDDDVSAILDCATAGATGYVTANASLDDLVDAIVRAAAGELLCSPRMAAALLRRAAGHTDQRPPDDRGLTVRQREVLTLLARGLSNKEIGSALNIAEATVKNHVHQLLTKLQVQTRTQAAYAASAVASPARLRQRSAPLL